MTTNPDPPLPAAGRERLLRLAGALIDQGAATVAVPANRPEPGYWFGGGNLVPDPAGDGLLLCGRYRDAGDSRTGTGAGERGLAFALFRAARPGGAFEPVARFTKADLAGRGPGVVSIEGGSLLPGPDGLELFISTEREGPYPSGLGAYQKPGTGVWSIGQMSAPAADQFDAATLVPCLDPGGPADLHVKDPVAFALPSGGTALLYCSHPYTWSSSNTGLALRADGGGAFVKTRRPVLARGAVWDVAAARVTERLAVPRLAFADLPPLSLYFYDGAECLRQLDENPNAVRRPRGYSCEELGGLAWGYDAGFPAMESLTPEAPLFVSPRGTGCSRYVSTCAWEGGVAAAWQQSQDDGSQPLVLHFLPAEQVAEILA